MADAAPPEPREEPAATVVVIDDQQARRYVATLGGHEAGHLRYARAGGADSGAGGRLIALGTEVDERFEGRGIGSALVRRLFDDARAEGVGVVPRCPFVRAYAVRHPEYADVVGAGS